MAAESLSVGFIWKRMLYIEIIKESHHISSMHGLSPSDAGEPPASSVGSKSKECSWLRAQRGTCPADSCNPAGRSRKGEISPKKTAVSILRCNSLPFHFELHSLDGSAVLMEKILSWMEKMVFAVNAKQKGPNPSHWCHCLGILPTGICSGIWNPPKNPFVFIL